MNISNVNIDGGKPFDWGRTSADYAKFRDIYPAQFYEKITERNLCTKGQSVLDIGTGTGVLPRNLYSFGAKWTGIDISRDQIEQAKLLSEGTDIEYYVTSAENALFPDNSYDVITACQCYWYFDHKKLVPEFARILKPNGHVVFLCMEWLPFEDKIAGASEALVLKYNPDWSGKGAVMQPISISEAYNAEFEKVFHCEYKLNVHFTRESWNGRMKACRGIGASLTEKEIKSWEREHINLLTKTAPPEFDVLHYASVAILKLK